MNNKNMDTVIAYLKSWNNGRIAEGRKYVSDDYHFNGPIDEFHNANDAFTAFEQLAPVVEGIEIASILEQGDDLAAFYVFKVKAPIGHVPIAEHIKLRNGKVSDSRIYYDPRTFGNVMPLPPVKTQF
ncbi:MAG: nuclear transport factor 2 family protein [Pseudobdellovibrionaceae bacterium]